MKDFFKIFVGSFLIFFSFWFVSYKAGFNSLPIQSEDTIPAMFLPVTIIKEGTFYANSYYDKIISKYPHPDDKSYEKGMTPFYFKKVDDNYISAFPLITGFLALPVYLIPVLLGINITWTNLIYLSHISSALIISFTGYVFYLLVKNYFLKERTRAYLLTFIFLFANINFALVSQSLWQHGSVQLFAVLFLYFLFNKKYLVSGLSLSLAVLARPTAALFVPFLAVLVLESVNTGSKLELKKNFKPYVTFTFGFLLSVLFFVWYTNKYYLGIENNGYASQYILGWLSKFPEGFLGLWLSPSKGILIYSPIFIFSIVGTYLALKKKNYLKRENLKYLVFFSIVLVHTLILGRWKHWYGGWSFGYRMAADIIPFLVLLIVPFLNSDLFTKYKKTFFGLLIFSVLVQIFGIFFFDGIWHAAYDLGFENTSWLWSVKDSEFVFNIRRILVKLGYLQKACPTCAPV